MTSMSSTVSLTPHLEEAVGVEPTPTALALVAEAQAALDGIDREIDHAVKQRKAVSARITKLRAERKTFERIAKAATPRTRKS